MTTSTEVAIIGAGFAGICLAAQLKRKGFEDFVILDVNGVGYVVQCSARTLQKLPRPGEAAALAIETQVCAQTEHRWARWRWAERATTMRREVWRARTCTPI